MDPAGKQVNLAANRLFYIVIKIVHISKISAVFSGYGRPA